MLNINTYLEEYNNPYSECSMEELDFQLENIDFALEQCYNELEEPEISLEDKVIHDAGSFSGRMWDDWLTSKTRLFRGIADLLRSKESAIKAYRKLLERESTKLRNDLSGDNSNHSASFVSMEKYWQFPNAAYPTSIISAVTKDLNESKKLLLDAPKSALTNIAKLGDIVKGADSSTEETLKHTFFNKVEQLKSVEEIIGSSIYFNYNTFLYTTIVLSNAPEKYYKSFYSRIDLLAKKNKLIVINGDSTHDAVKAIIVAITPRFPLGGLVWGLIRVLSPPGFTLTNREMGNLLAYADNFLDVAETSLVGIKKANEEASHILLKINTLLAEIKKEGKGDKATIKQMTDFITGYSTNMLSFIDKPMLQMVNREIKMAKGIFYMVARTIGRKA